EQGDLIFQLGDKEIRQPKPFIYQTVRGVRREIEGGYQMQDKQTVNFRLGEFDPALPLVIDPVLSYSTFFGGSGADIAWALAVDTNGFVYVAGETLSANLPTGLSSLTNKFSGGNGLHGDAFVVKFNNLAKGIIYRTYIGGKTEDAAFGLALDGEGDA